MLKTELIQTIPLATAGGMPYTDSPGPNPCKLEAIKLAHVMK